MEIELNRVCISKFEPVFTPHGYVVTDDGKIHSLTQQCCHGVVLALLFPDLCKKSGYCAPTEDFDVFEYQAFELDHSRETSAIRISSSIYDGQLNLSKGKSRATKQQVSALSLIFKQCGLSINEKVQSDMSELTIRSFMKKLESGEI